MKSRVLMKSGVLAVLLLSFAATTAWAQGAKASLKGAADRPAAAATADTARFDALRAEGFEALYNLDYERARRTFREMARLFPDHPAGPHFLATTVWLRTLNESRRLQASLYNTEGFYAKAKEETDPKVVAEFRELTTQAKSLADARRKRDPKSVETLYYLGVIEGLKAAFAGAVERSFYSAWRDGQEAADRHRDVLKLDPTFHDAEITLGMYDYVASTLPLPFRVGGAMLGVRGSKKRGLATLERVAREGRWAQDDAKVLLIALYKRERRFAEALTFARELAAKYQRNYLFKLEVADALVSLAAAERAAKPDEAEKLEREAFATFDALLQQKPAKGEPARPLDLIHFSYGQGLAVAGQHERAAKEYLSGAAVPGAEAGLATMSRLRAAQSLDLAGRREEAVKQYQEVLARPNIYDSHEQAQRGVREPFRPQAQHSAEGSAEKAESVAQ
jgi:tetratricopeptide (TPR) repeat protein